MLKHKRQAVQQFVFRPPELREAELRYLHCLVTHFANSNTLPPASGLLSVSWVECCERIKQQVAYFEYCAFPVRLRALCLELAGDMEKLMAIHHPQNDIRKRDMFRRQVLRAYEYYRLALDIREGIGISFSNTSFSVALMRDKAAELLDLMEKQLADDSLDGGDLTTLLTFLARGHDSPLTESQCHEVKARVQYRYAVEAYRRSVSNRTMGREFWFQYRSLSYLTDDVHGEEVHFSLACERMMNNYSRRRMDEIHKEGHLSPDTN
jgi:hypothetical protein